MNLFIKKVTWANWQFAVFKISMVALGIILGFYFADFWQSLIWLAWVIFIITAIWTTIMWFKALK
ncbi:MAG: hypothetical protein ACE5WD_13405 [Candidatus Aminicenantia bacterium]